MVFPVRYSATDLLYTIERSFDLSGPWTLRVTFNAATGILGSFFGNPNVIFGPASITFTDPGLTGQPKVFYRLRAQITAP